MTQSPKYLISNENDLKELEGKLQDHLYVHGNNPGSEDTLLYYQWWTTKTEPCKDKYPNLWEWYSLVSLYNHRVLELWKEVKPMDTKQQQKDEKTTKSPHRHKKTKEETDHTKPTHHEAPVDECDDLFADEDPEEEAKRQALAEKMKKDKEEKAKKKKPAPIAKSIVLLDIKVFEIDQDLDALAKKIFAEVQKDGLIWKTEYQLLDVAFGIKKIRIGCVIEDEKVSVDEDLIDNLQSWEDEIQSVDIVSFNKV